MPIYEYVCNDCGEHYEQIVLSQNQKVACPKCTSGRHTLQLSVFAAHGSSSSGASAGPMPGGGSCACGHGGCGLPRS